MNGIEFYVFLQVRKHVLSITNILDVFKRSTLISQNDFVSDESVDIDKLSKQIECIVENKVESLLHSYRSLKPLLLKIESVVSEAICTGSSSELSSYYFHVQINVYNALSEVVVRSLANLRQLLLSQLNHQRTYSKGVPNYNNQLINDAYIAQVHRCTRLITSTPKRFIRWMNGTCSEAAIKLDEDDILGLSQPPSITYYEAIARNKYIIGCLVTIYRDLISYLNR